MVWPSGKVRIGVECRWWSAKNEIMDDKGKTLDCKVYNPSLSWMIISTPPLPFML